MRRHLALICGIAGFFVLTASAATDTNDPISLIREEGLNRSQVMQTLSYLTEAIGPRLTGSPQMKRANEWTRDTMSSWGMVNATLEPWGTFGRGWSLQRFSAQVIEPFAFPLNAYPKAWTPGLERPLEAEVIYLEARTEDDLAKYKGKLKGAIVLTRPAREVKARFDPLALRFAETNLLRLANAGAPEDGRSRRSPRTSRPPANIAAAGTSRPDRVAGSGLNTRTNNVGVTNATAAAPRTNAPARPVSTSRLLTFLVEEDAAAQLTPSSQGDGGTLFVSSASFPTSGGSTSSRAWATNAARTVPQIALTAEDYNRLVRMVQHGEKVKMALEMQVAFHKEDLTAYNTVAEIPGSDLKDEIVMLGAHLDSWHAGTGATDNAAGVAAIMEAARILRAAKLEPRRTIRVALWTGEEQGLLGSRAYVTKHFGFYTNTTPRNIARSPRDEESSGARRTSSRETTRKLVRHGDYEKLSAYFNLDNGTGKIRGVYMQGNEAVRPLFRRWLQPFADLDAETLTLSNTGGTDHVPFDSIGLPGFQFIQDPIEYWSRTHHSNADVYDRIQADDMKQAATIIAAFAWNAATMDEQVPRKPIEEPEDRRGGIARRSE